MSATKNHLVEFHLSVQSREIAEMSRRKRAIKNLVAGINLTVLPKVYPGGVDSELVCEAMVVRDGDSVLDLCTGTGVIALKAAQMGAAKVVGVDLNPEAIKTANMNKEALRLERVCFLEGELFDPVKDEQFDVITINPPYTSKKPTNKTEICFWDENNQTSRTFFRDFRRHLKRGGKVYFAWADFATKPKLPQQLAREHGLRLKKLGQKTSDSGNSTFWVYQILSDR